MKIDHESGATIISMLRGAGWLFAIVSAIACMVIWAAYGQIEVAVSAYSSTTVTRAYGPGIGVALAVLAQGLLTGLLLCSLAYLIENVASIQQLLSAKDEKAHTDKLEAESASEQANDS